MIANNRPFHLKIFQLFIGWTLNIEQLTLNIYKWMNHNSTIICVAELILKSKAQMTKSSLAVTRPRSDESKYYNYFFLVQYPAPRMTGIINKEWINWKMFNSIDGNHLTNCYVKMVNIHIFHSLSFMCILSLNDDDYGLIHHRMNSHHDWLMSEAKWRYKKRGKRTGLFYGNQSKMYVQTSFHRLCSISLDNTMDRHLEQHCLMIYALYLCRVYVCMVYVWRCLIWSQMIHRKSEHFVTANNLVQGIIQHGERPKKATTLNKPR